MATNFDRTHTDWWHKTRPFVAPLRGDAVRGHVRGMQF